MSCGYTETIGASKFKCVNGVLKEFPTVAHIWNRHNAPPITGRKVGDCPMCGGGNPVRVGFYCWESAVIEQFGVFNVRGQNSHCHAS